MHSGSTAAGGLDVLIRNALCEALKAGRSEVILSLEAALSAAGEQRRQSCEIDVLAAEVRLEGTRVRLSRGELALTMALALQRRRCSREELIELLYPHMDLDTAATQLRVYVYRVRRQLRSPRAIIFQTDGYHINPDFIVDFREIEAFVGDAMQTRGALDHATIARLDGVRKRLINRNVAWMGDREWCNTLDRRLQMLLFDVTTRLGEAALVHGDVRAASLLATEILDLDPCDERGAELAIRSRLGVGDRVGAVRQFRRYERALREEYAASPSAELSALLAI